MEKRDYLSYPEKFDSILADRVNDGCGPKGWKGALVPDKLLGVDKTECCRIHDYEFFLGGELVDFETANWRFHYNIRQEIKKVKYTKFLNFWRRKNAMIYYKAVSCVGDLYFNWKDGKNEYKEKHKKQEPQPGGSFWINGEDQRGTTA